MNHLSTEERIFLGKKFEQETIQILHKNGIEFKEPTLDEDKYDKIDGYIKINNVFESVQFKKRLTGKDLIFDIYEPYFGVKDSRTRNGRDSSDKYTHYFCLVENRIYWARSVVVKKIITDLLSKWVAAREPNTFRDVSGNEVKIHKDAYGGVMKVVVFIKPYTIKDIVVLK